jgi:hypothetical protein
MVKKRQELDASLMILGIVGVVAVLVLILNSTGNPVGKATQVDLLKTDFNCEGERCDCGGMGPEYCPSFFGEGTCCDLRYPSFTGGTGKCCSGVMNEKTGNCIVSLCSGPGETN